MTKIPLKIKKEILADTFYCRCARAGLGGHECDGRITWEHTLIYGGKQIQKKWAIIPLCAKAHSVDHWQDGGDLDKEINEWIAISRASDLELMEVSKGINYIHRRYYLNQKYGVYKPVYNLGKPCGEAVGIQYGPVENSRDFHY